jgi:hypothetical protein
VVTARCGGARAPGDRVVLEPGTSRPRCVAWKSTRAVPEARRAAHGGGPGRVPRAARGTWVLAPGSLARPHARRADPVLPDAGKPLVQRQRCASTWERARSWAGCALLEGDELVPGVGLAQLRLEAPAVADRGIDSSFALPPPARAIAGAGAGPASAHSADRRDRPLTARRAGPQERLLSALGREPGGSAARPGPDSEDADQRDSGAPRLGRAVDVGDWAIARDLWRPSPQAETSWRASRKPTPAMGSTGASSRAVSTPAPAGVRGGAPGTGERGRVSLRGPGRWWRGRTSVAGSGSGTGSRGSGGDRRGRQVPSPRELEERPGFRFGHPQTTDFRGAGGESGAEFFLSVQHFRDLLSWLDRWFTEGEEPS